MKKMLGLVVSLTVISGVCAAVLASVNEITADPIREVAEKNEKAAVRKVMPANVSTIEAKEGGVFVGKDDNGAVAGYAAKGTSGEGYGGDIELMVGFEKDAKTLVCYETLLATETPGLGMKLNSPDFKGQFGGKDGASLKVVKDGGAIEAITSATITSRAVCKAIEAAQGKVASVK